MIKPADFTTSCLVLPVVAGNVKSGASRRGRGGLVVVAAGGYEVVMVTGVCEYQLALGLLFNSRRRGL